MAKGRVRNGEAMMNGGCVDEQDSAPRWTAGNGLARVASTVALVALGACATTGSAPSGTPVDGRNIAARAVESSALDRPYQVVFDWNLTEPGARMSGQGVARLEPPANVRLDLFTNRGERVAVAALVGEELRVPRYDQTELPPAPFLWASLGVFLPNGSAAPAEGWQQDNGTVELRYAQPDGDVLAYRLANDRVEELRSLRNGRTREELRLVLRSDDPFPREAVYRHLEDVRELRISLESVEHVESHPTDIWDPGT